MQEIVCIRVLTKDALLALLNDNKGLSVGFYGTVCQHALKICINSFFGGVWDNEERSVMHEVHGEVCPIVLVVGAQQMDAQTSEEVTNLWAPAAQATELKLLAQQLA